MRPCVAAMQKGRWAVRNPEFQLVAWTLKFYVQVESNAAISTKVAAGKTARTAENSRAASNRKR